MGVQERREREKQGIREEILAAARALFVQEGYENVSIRKIAERIEYSPGTIYLYFQDKADILAQISEETFARLERKLAAINRDTSIEPLERLRSGLRAYIRFGLEHPHRYVLTFMRGSIQCPAGSRCFGELMKGVGFAMEAGQIEDGDVVEISQALWAGSHGVASLLVTCTDFPFVEHGRLVERMLEIMMEGVRKR
ncbi:MAG TPA: TetR/AcrR family transcriptional regulator [Bryobacteraceae bacterium]|jgi:AcrR family transcriptional regulator|nr:TetR/AcrR family transcriptional regulator [Bryobacteraceae bacterium]